MYGSFQFSLPDESLSMHNCADSAVWQLDSAWLIKWVVTELAWTTRLFMKTNNLAYSICRMNHYWQFI